MFHLNVRHDNSLCIGQFSNISHLLCHVGFNISNLEKFGHIQTVTEGKGLLSFLGIYW